jgi:HAD superfamily hydrolase (TIGR01549 family)
MSKVLFIDYDETLHDTYSKFRLKLDGIYGLSAAEIMDAYFAVHRGIVHTQFPERHDDFFFHQRLLADRLGIPYDEAQARDMGRRFKEAQEASWTTPAFFPEALYFLDKAKERHVLCLTTGDHAEKKARAIEKASGRSHFSYVFDHTHLGLKGSSAYFENALMSTNSSPDEAVVIGDSLEHDIAAAKGAGIMAIWVNRRGQARDGDSAEADFEAADLLGVLHHLEGL